MAPIATADLAPVLEGKTKLSDSNNDPAVRKVLAAAISRFEQNNPRSKEQHEVAINSLPGGNTRTLLHTSAFPLSMKSGKGPYVIDEDGHEYVDFVGELTAGIYGHSYPVIREAIVSTFDNIGMNLGSTIVQEQKHAQLMCTRFNLDRIRFTNSGTEANLHALNGARRYTGRDKIVVFSGGYHGAVLSFGNGTVAFNNVNRSDWVIAQYNNVEAARQVIEQTEGVAAVLVEAMQGAGGCILGTSEFLHAIEDSARKVEAVFILDEVMTSRLAPGGIQTLLNLKPDITTFGKYLGGGFAFGAFGGRADIMAVYDPRTVGSLAHSGTFNNNTMAMSAGYAGLSTVYTPEKATEFNLSGDVLRKRSQAVSRGTKCSFTGRDAIMAVHFSDNGLEDISCVDDFHERWDLTDLSWLEMLEDGYWLTRRGSIALILDTPAEELNRFVDCVSAFLQKHQHLVRL